MAVPDFQSLMRPVLEISDDEIRIHEAVHTKAFR